ncbi:hypothetical protein ACJIZ3_014545 [Penstemon smallii]|uniref:PB1 domain-containing protein n=1 Tax=Penstemon smallii TaxID=265156 RepID=A0ABD3RLU4_9LAMI
MDPTPPPPPSSKLRLMCSYGGHIIPRPHDKSLFYAGGETRIVALDRRTTASSLSSFTAHLSRTLFHNRAFHLKYQLPNEDLDSLISVVTDDDLFNMLEEHDRITAPVRIRLFLFPVKPESLGSTLLDPKSETWFCDALKSTRIMQSADSGLLMGFGSGLEGPVESGSKVGAESLVLETSSSFGSTGSSFSVSNSPPIGMVHYEDNGGLNLLDANIRVPSSASIESEISVARAAPPPKTGISEEPLIQIAPEVSSLLIDSESTISDLSISIPTQNTVQVLGYPSSQQPDRKELQYETQLIEGGLQYVPQYPANPMPFSPYYPVYQMPMHQQHVPYPPNPPYPIYLVPVRPPQYHNMSMQCNLIDTNTTTSTRPPLYPQTSVITPPITHKEVFGAQPVTESATKNYQSILASSPVISIPSNEVMTGTLEPENASEPVTTTSVASTVESSEFDEDIAYNQIYKTQPLAPILPSQYQTMTKGTAII